MLPSSPWQFRQFLSTFIIFNRRAQWRNFRGVPGQCPGAKARAKYTAKFRPPRAATEMLMVHTIGRGAWEASPNNNDSLCFCSSPWQCLQSLLNVVIFSRFAQWRIFRYVPGPCPCAKA